MDLVNIIEKVRHQHVYIQDERQNIHKLNVDVCISVFRIKFPMNE